MGDETATRNSSGTVLVVDDHDLVRGLIADILRNAGFAVIEADGGQKALDILREEGRTVSCILQDMSMPGMSGPETIRETLSMLPEARIIVLSVDDEATAMHELGDLSVTGYLEKPCDSDLLVETVRQTINSG